MARNNETCVKASAGGEDSYLFKSWSIVYQCSNFSIKGRQGEIVRNLSEKHATKYAERCLNHRLFSFMFDQTWCILGEKLGYRATNVFFFFVQKLPSLLSLIVKIFLLWSLNADLIQVMTVVVQVNDVAHGLL